MAIPGFQRMMLPILEFCQTDKPITIGELSVMIADHFKLTEEDRSLSIAPGRLRYKGRVAWAVGHLSDAGLLEKISEVEYRITSAGKDVLDGRPEKIDLKFQRRVKPAERGDSIKPGVEQSGTPGSEEYEARATEWATAHHVNRTFSAIARFARSVSLIFVILGFRFAPPQALRLHPLRGL